MQVSFNPNVNFKQQIQTQGIAGQNSVPYNVPVQPAVVANKKSSSFKEKISNVAKFFTNLSEMTKATVKAFAYGGLTSFAIGASYWTFGAFPRGLRSKEKGAFKNVLNKPFKSLSTQGKVITLLAGASVAAFQLIKGKLTANQRTANVDHQLKTGHRNA